MEVTGDHAGYAGLLRAELTKFRTVRAWMIALCAAAVAFVLLAVVSAAASRSPLPAVAAGPGGEAVSDTYMFVHQPLTGDGTLSARIASLSGAHASPSPDTGRAASQSSRVRPGSRLRPGLAPWAKAGLILEPGTRPGTAYAAVMLTGSHGVRMQYDYTHDIPAPAGPAGPAAPSSPRWLRLTRAGDTITGYDSADGVRWSEIGSARLAGLPRTVQIGLFVTSPLYFAAGAGQGIPSAATASFDDVSGQGQIPRRSWTPTAVTGLYLQAAPSGWRQRSASAFTITGSGDIAPLVGDIISAQWAGASIVNGTIVALLFVIVLAALSATSEYRRGLIRTTFAASPRRGRVVAAKAIVAGSLAFAAGAIATAIAEVLTRHVLAANGSYLFPQSGPALARVVIGTGLVLGLAAALVVALGLMLRRATITVAAGVMLLVLPGILGSASGNWLMRFSPTAAFAIQATLPRSSLVTSAYTPPNGYFPVSPWTGLGVLAAYAAIALAAATWFLNRRDA